MMVTQFFDLITRRRRKEGLIDKLCCCSAHPSTSQPTNTKYTKERKNTQINQPTNAKYKDIKKENTKNINSAAAVLNRRPASRQRQNTQKDGKKHKNKPINKCKI